MMLLRPLRGCAMFLGSWSSAFGQYPPDPCVGGPLETRSILRCRDGDPSCDMDGVCDGTCFGWVASTPCCH
jgi:hypothetical protein